MRTACFFVGWGLVLGAQAPLDVKAHQGTRIEIDPVPMLRALNEKEFPDLKFPDTNAGLVGRHTFLRNLIGMDGLDSSVTGQGVRVGVVDTGIMWTHPDLYQHMDVVEGEVPENDRDDDQNGFVDDDRGFNFALNSARYDDLVGHGTMSAGLISSRALGLAPGSRVASFRVFSKEGYASFDGMVRALKYAKHRGVKVVNISMAGWGVSQSLNDVFEELEKDDQILVVAAAGNDGADCAKVVRYPATHKASNLITVAATNFNSREKLSLTPYSARGQSCVDIAAPAGNNEALPTTQNSYRGARGLYFGTSAAAPVVSAVAALVWSACPKLKASQVREIVLGNATRVERLAEHVPAGRFVQAKPAVQEAKKRCE